MTELTLNACATEFMMDAQRVLSIAEEVAEAIAQENLDGASLVLGTQTGKLGSLNEDWDNLHKRVRDAGGDYRRALDQPS